jgi:hypothetical protein
MGHAQGRLQLGRNRLADGAALLPAVPSLRAVQADDADRAGDHYWDLRFDDDQRRLLLGPLVGEHRDLPPREIDLIEFSTFSWPIQDFAFDVL